MGALIKWAGLFAVGALGVRGVTDGVKDLTSTTADSVQKVTPILVVGVGAAAMVGAAFIITKGDV